MQFIMHFIILMQFASHVDLPNTNSVFSYTIQIYFSANHGIGLTEVHSLFVSVIVTQIGVYTRSVNVIYDQFHSLDGNTSAV